MKRTLTILTTGLVLCALPGLSLAKGLRIGVVNMQRAVGETNEGKNAEKELQKMKGKLENELNRKLKEMDRARRPNGSAPPTA